MHRGTLHNISERCSRLDCRQGFAHALPVADAVNGERALNLLPGVECLDLRYGTKLAFAFCPWAGLLVEPT